eukprot:3323033-Amphidinium_carterae.1
MGAFEACSAYSDADADGMVGNIVLVLRGGCNFHEQAISIGSEDLRKGRACGLSSSLACSKSNGADERVAYAMSMVSGEGDNNTGHAYNTIWGAALSHDSTPHAHACLSLNHGAPMHLSDDWTSPKTCDEVLDHFLTHSDQLVLLLRTRSLRTVFLRLGRVQSDALVAFAILKCGFACRVLAGRAPTHSNLPHLQHRGPPSPYPCYVNIHCCVLQLEAIDSEDYWGEKQKLQINQIHESLGSSSRCCFTQTLAMGSFAIA